MGLLKIQGKRVPNLVGIILVIVVLQLTVPITIFGGDDKEILLDEDQKTIEIQAKGKSTDEIRDEIIQKLKAEGFTNPEVLVEKAGDSIFDISVDLSDSTDKNTSKGILKIKLSGDTDKFDIPLLDKAQTVLDIDVEGKSNEEVKALVEEKLAKEGKEGAEVEVKTTSDGKKEIKVKLEKEETIKSENK